MMDDRKIADQWFRGGHKLFKVHKKPKTQQNIEPTTNYSTKKPIKLTEKWMTDSIFWEEVEFETETLRKKRQQQKENEGNNEQF